MSLTREQLVERFGAAERVETSEAIKLDLPVFSPDRTLIHRYSSEEAFNEYRKVNLEQHHITENGITQSGPYTIEGKVYGVIVIDSNLPTKKVRK